MTQNPYESPSTQAVPVAHEFDLKRQKAIWSLRYTYLILVMPALYNNACLNIAAFTFSPVPGAKPITSGAWIVVFGFAVLFSIVIGGLWWFLSLACIERITRIIHWCVSKQLTCGAWINRLHDSFGKLYWYAIPGAILWGSWVYAYYQLEMDSISVSIAAGIAAHILAAAWYIPLFFNWYQIDRASLTDQKPG